MFNIPNIINGLLLIITVLISITIHEFSHGYVAYKQGDDTAKIYRRLTLNPLKHIDIFGIICLVFFKFGWAKPVPVNSANFKNRKTGILAVSLAGPLSNLILAFLSRIVFFVSISISLNSNYIFIFLQYLTLINLGLCVFNLIPIPPLDGSKIVGAFLKGGTAYKYLSLERYAPVIMLLIFFIPRISNLFSGFLNAIVEIILSGFDIVILNLIQGII